MVGSTLESKQRGLYSSIRTVRGMKYTTKEEACQSPIKYSSTKLIPVFGSIQPMLTADRPATGKSSQSMWKLMVNIFILSSCMQLLQTHMHACISLYMQPPTTDLHFQRVLHLAVVSASKTHALHESACPCMVEKSCVKFMHFMLILIRNAKS